MPEPKEGPSERVPVTAALVIAVSVAALIATLAVTCTERLTGPLPPPEDLAAVDWDDGPGDRQTSDAELPIGALGEPSEIVSSFNQTPIGAGRTIWFAAVARIEGPTTGPFTVRFRNAAILFRAGETDYVVRVPDASVTFDPDQEIATTRYDHATGSWVTFAPFGLDGDLFLSGATLPVTATLPGGIEDISWSGDFSADRPGVCTRWRWSAAVYGRFARDLDEVGVKASDDARGDVYAVPHRAGTPEAFREHVVGGAGGEGGSNWTGSFSREELVCDLPA